MKRSPVARYSDFCSPSCWAVGTAATRYSYSGSAYLVMVKGDPGRFCLRLHRHSDCAPSLLRVDRDQILYGVLTGLSLSAVGAIVCGVRRTQGSPKWRPNQGLKLTIRNAALTAVVAAAASTLAAFGLQLSFLIAGNDSFSWSWRGALYLTLRELPATIVFTFWFAALLTGGSAVQRQYILQYFYWVGVSS